MNELSQLGKSMLRWFSDFWSWVTETKLGDITTLFPDAIEGLPVVSVILGAVVTLYLGWVLITWALDILP